MTRHKKNDLAYFMQTILVASRNKGRMGKRTLWKLEIGDKNQQGPMLYDFLRQLFTNFHNKLECLSLVRLSNLV